MSQAPVGQRSAHRLQCRHTSSSLTITRSVFSGSDTYRSCSRFSDGAVSRVRRSASSPLVVKVMQSVGQMSTQASHSMHLRSEEHTSELQSLMRISYAVFCLKKKKTRMSKINDTTRITTARED